MTSQNLVDYDWINTQGAQEYITSILHRGKRRLFGLLERPSLPPQKMPDVLNFKIFICGKSSVGKTATISKLAGCQVQSAINETAAIETTLVYWPMRLSHTGKIVFFALNFWDVGENAVKKFDHVLPACKADVDGIIYTFSFTDRSSFVDIPYLMSRLTTEEVNEPAQMIVGTKADQYAYSDISDVQIEELSTRRNVPVLRTKNTSGTLPDGRENVLEVAPIMNKLCNLLILREQCMANVAPTQYTV